MKYSKKFSHDRIRIFFDNIRVDGDDLYLYYDGIFVAAIDNKPIQVIRKIPRNYGIPGIEDKLCLIFGYK